MTVEALTPEGVETLPSDKVGGIDYSGADGRNFEADTRPSITQVKKRRGRPPKVAGAQTAAPSMGVQPAQVCTIFSANYCGAIANLPFKIAADFSKIAELELDSDDKAFLGSPLADVLNELYPELIAKYPKWAVLLMGFAAIASKKAVEVSILRKIKLGTPKRTDEQVHVSASEARPASASHIPEPSGVTETELRLKEKLQGA